MQTFGCVAIDALAAIIPYAMGTYSQKLVAAGTKILSKADDYVKTGVWTMKAFDRGWEIEKALGGWCNNFPTIDWAIKTVRNDKTYLESIKSIKSMDITLPSYQKQSTLYNKLKKYVDELVDFDGVKKWKGVEYQVSQGSTRTLEIAVPPVEMTSMQADVFNEIIKYASMQTKKIDVVIRIVE